MCQELLAHQASLGWGRVAKIDSFEFRPSRGKREKMKNSYFETIDERIFQDCSLLRYSLEQEYRKSLELAKQQEELELAT